MIAVIAAPSNAPQTSQAANTRSRKNQRSSSGVCRAASDGSAWSNAARIRAAASMSASSSRPPIIAALLRGFLVFDEGRDDVLLGQRDGLVGGRHVIARIDIGELQREETNQRCPEI